MDLPDLDGAGTKLRPYQQIAAVLRDVITQGRLAVGALIPSEAELACRYAVPQATVTGAIQLLRDEGLVAIQDGQCAFVVSAVAGGAPGAPYPPSEPLSEPLPEPLPEPLSEPLPEPPPVPARVGRTIEEDQMVSDSGFGIDLAAARETEPVVKSADKEEVVPSADRVSPVKSADEGPVAGEAGDPPPHV
jgi:hypothetical protein